MSSCSDLTVLVTGGTSGIGAACVAEFVNAGAQVITTGRRQDRLESLCERHGDAVSTLCFDVRDRDAVDTALSTLTKPVDVLVNNAGLALGLDAVHTGDEDQWDTMVQTNITGLLNVSRRITPGMVEAGQGHVINIGSIAGHEAYPGGMVYCATKHAVNGLTNAMRHDLLGTGVRVTSIDPGMVETEFSLVRFNGDSARAEKVYDGVTPLRASDIADTVVWAATRPKHVQIAEIIVLASDQSGATRTTKKI